MDTRPSGRPHPSKNAPHEQTGFTTGVWNGNELIATTTHLETGYIRRNGAASRKCRWAGTPT